MITADDFIVKQLSHYDQHQLEVEIIIPSQLKNFNNIRFDVHDSAVLVNFDNESIILYLGKVKYVMFQFTNSDSFREIEIYSHNIHEIDLSNLFCYSLEYVKSDIQFKTRLYDCNIETFLSQVKLGEVRLYDTGIQYMLNTNIILIKLNDSFIRMMCGCRILSLELSMADIKIIRSTLIDIYGADELSTLGEVCDIRLAKDDNSNLSIKQYGKRKMFNQIEITNSIMEYLLTVSI